MIYIKKHPDSDAINEINRIRRDMNWRQINKADSHAVRTVFDQLNKAVIRTSLYNEQKGICAYCMRRIQNDSTSALEHYVPIAEDGNQALEYQNLLLCCDGGRTAKNDRRVLSCDAAKGDKQITLSPVKKEHMELIRYDKEGRIYTDPTNTDFEKEIKDVLRLNGIVDKDGNTITDTATGLVYGRKEATKNCFKLITELRKRNKCTRQELEKRYHRIAEETPLREYAGVWLYWLGKTIKGLG